ncbi:MAG TPA: hypothetical protein VJ810_02395 [Blastocatellia bacterium]|nr:hypothetical protein [Blastocatellia bacterium]
MLNHIQYNKLFRQKFRRAYDEIELLEEKIYETKGVIFVSHRYTKDQLLNSKHVYKLFAIAEKIGSDAMNWYQRGQLPDWAQEKYLKQRDKVERRFERVRSRIEARPQTWWENVRSGYMKFVRKVMGLLPLLRKSIGGGKAPKLLSDGKAPKLLK